MKCDAKQIETFTICPRLQDQLADEYTKYQREILHKQRMIRECEFRMQKQHLDKLQNERELERQKFVELKQLQQHL